MAERSFILVNGTRVDVKKEDYGLTLLAWLRLRANMLSVRTGCGAKKNCGICLVQVDGSAVLSCSVEVRSILTKHVCTVEGIPEEARIILAEALLSSATVPCGYCTAGLLVKIYTLLQQGVEHTRDEVIAYLGYNHCTCMGAKQIIDAVLQVQKVYKVSLEIPPASYGGLTKNAPRFGEHRVVLGQKPFAEDVFFEEAVQHAICVWNTKDHNQIVEIHTSEAKKMLGVQAVITKCDIYNNTVVMPDKQEWNLFIGEGDIGYCKSELVAVIVADTEQHAREALAGIMVTSKELDACTDSIEALATALERGEETYTVHTLQYGEPIENLLQKQVYTVNEVFSTISEPYVPLERPSVFAMNTHGHLYIYTQVADIQWLKHALQSSLGIDLIYIHCIRMESNILFDAREDYFLALSAGIASYITGNSVRLEMTHEEVATYRSRPITTTNDYTLFMDTHGVLQGAKITILLNGGAYTSNIEHVYTSIMKHVASGYKLPSVDVRLIHVHTNGTPCYFVRGKSIEVPTIIMNRLLDKLSKLSRFNRYELRTKNILREGEYTVFGEYLFGSLETDILLERIKEYYDSYPSVSISIGAVETGLASTNAFCMVAIDVLQGGDIIVYQPYPDFGNGLTTLIAQTIVGILGSNSYEKMTIRSTTDCMAPMQTIPHCEGAMLYLVHHAIEDATKQLQQEKNAVGHTSKLWGKRFIGTATISTEKIHTVEKELVAQGNYTLTATIARCDTPYSFIKVVNLISAGVLWNPQFCTTLAEGGISVAYGMLCATVLNNTMQPNSTIIEYIHNKTDTSSYGFTSVYDASVIGVASSFYSYFFINAKENIMEYPLQKARG